MAFAFFLFDWDFTIGIERAPKKKKKHGKLTKKTVNILHINHRKMPMLFFVVLVVVVVVGIGSVLFSPA